MESNKSLRLLVESIANGMTEPGTIFFNDVLDQADVFHEVRSFSTHRYEVQSLGSGADDVAKTFAKVPNFTLKYIGVEYIEDEDEYDIEYHNGQSYADYLKDEVYQLMEWAEDKHIKPGAVILSRGYKDLYGNTRTVLLVPYSVS